MEQIEAAPYFSIVIPAFNREKEVCRAVASCLAQSFADFEVVVVDDGSADRTAGAVAVIPDSRVRLMRHARNRGVCPARNTGIRASSGQWVVFLDSDHEMLPGCLDRAFQITGATGAAGIDRFGFMFRYDDGQCSPSPFPGTVPVGYVEWLRWIDRGHRTDSLWVTRRECFDRCLMPDSTALEFSFCLDFARLFRTRFVAETLALQYTDSPNRLSSRSLPPEPDAIRRRALDELADWEYVLAQHGTALQQYAPRRYTGVLRGASMAHTLAGQRSPALRMAL